MNLISIFCDIAIILAVLLIIFFSYKKGFALSALGLAAWILALIISQTASTPAAEFVYDYAETFFLGETNDRLDTNIVIDDDIGQKINYLYEELPQITVNTIEFFGNSPEKITQNIKTAFSDTALITVRNIIDVSIKPVILSLLKTIFLLIFFIILLPLLQLLAKIISKPFKLPVISSFDKVLGGLLGLIKGIIFIVIISILLRVIVTATNNQNEFINYDLLNSSYIFSLIDKYKFWS